MELDKLQGHLEAVLFAAAKPLHKGELAEILGISESVLEELLTLYEVETQSPKRGIGLRISGAGVELVTARDSQDYVKKIRAREEKLSKAALETLAVIAFKQPITKAEIEALRGVNSERVLKQLVERHMVVELGRKDTIGRPMLYGTTDEFLRTAGIGNLQELDVHAVEEVKGMSLFEGLETAETEAGTVDQ